MHLCSGKRNTECFLPSGSPSPGVSHGLYNQGATCYLSSVLQLLHMTPEFHDRSDSVACFQWWSQRVALPTPEI